MADNNKNKILSLAEFRNCALKEQPLKYFANLMRQKEEQLDK